METMEWKFPESHWRDRGNWSSGEWDYEPDKVQWEDEDTGMPCLIVRNDYGALCGYVGVDESHPLYKVEYSECPLSCKEQFCEHSPDLALSAHGGITYSDLCMEDEKERGICHIAAPGEPDPLWWFGFDTAHSGDLCPRDAPPFRWETYRNRAYVEAECAELARQLAHY